MQLDKKKIAILATHGFEQSELEVPRDKLKAAGATVHVVSLKAGEIKGWDMKDWGRPLYSVGGVTSVYFGAYCISPFPNDQSSRALSTRVIQTSCLRMPILALRSSAILR